MKLQPTERFAKDYERLPQHLQHRWEGRVTLHYRFIFTLEEETYVLLRVGTHDLLK